MNNNLMPVPGKMEVPTFDQLPQVVARLYDKLDNIERLLMNKETAPVQESKTLLTVPDAAKFLSLSVQTIYQLVSRGEIPCMKRSRRVYFSKDELLDYLKAGRKLTGPEIDNKTDAYLSKLKRKGSKQGRASV